MKDQQPNQRSAINRLFCLIETIIEHRLFKPVAISIITSFILFGSFSYLKTYLEERKFYAQRFGDERQIKINIPDSYYGLSINDNQNIQYQIKSGDTLMKVLLDLGADELDVFSILSEMRKVYNPKLINAGDRFLIKYQAHLSYTKDKNQNDGQLNTRNPTRKVFVTNISFNPSPEKQITVTGAKNSNGEYSYQAKEITKKLTKHVVKYSATIKNGLYVDGTDVGVSPNIMINMINLYSFDVDFQRDIREGDKFEVLFESFYDEEGNRVKDGDVLFASLDLQRKRTIDMYLHKMDGKNEYFDAKGNSVKKSLLRTPINGARISSGFGMRRHPILGYSKMHKGIDFAAPNGTPIFAAGSGTITHYGIKGGYGNFVQIRHTTDYSTGYGHASRFVRGLRVGSKVKQGDVVAYVGSTGRSTGPHLHYEIILKGTPVNPSGVKSTSGLKLAGKELNRFMSSKGDIEKHLKTTPNQNKS